MRIEQEEEENCVVTVLDDIHGHILQANMFILSSAMFLTQLSPNALIHQSLLQSFCEAIPVTIQPILLSPLTLFSAVSARF